jgi:hypothetical protein
MSLHKSNVKDMQWKERGKYGIREMGKERSMINDQFIYGSVLKSVDSFCRSVIKYNMNLRRKNGHL